MNSSNFKFKPDKIKYLSNIDTLDSKHKNLINSINKKREDLPKKIKKLEKLKNNLLLLNNTVEDYISIRAKLIEDIYVIENEVNEIENYEDEIDYYTKTHDILLNYYDIIDGQNINEINNIKETITNNKNLEENLDNYKVMEEIKQIENNDSSLVSEKNNFENIDNIEDWNINSIKIFNNKNSKLDMLNNLSKLKRKDKRTTRKRVKNVESLIKDQNNNIFDYINSCSIIKNNIDNIDNIENINIINNDTTIDNKNIYDRATLLEDYKILLEGYSNKKTNRTCLNCNIDKILIYSEGVYACMNCGEVENCIVESEISNYKDPMIEKPTFPYKRRNHFCEWINILFYLTARQSKYQKYLLV